MTDFRRGMVVWLSLSPTRGREQSGHRPALVVASDAYLAMAEVDRWLRDFLALP